MRLDARQRAVVSLAVGLLLIGGTVAVVDTAGGEPTERYHSVDVTVDDGSFEYTVPDDAQAPTELSGVDCHRSWSRACQLEHLLVDNATLIPEDRVRGDRFVQIEGKFYRRVAVEYNETHSKHLLNRVTADLVAGQISRPVADLDGNERAVVENGSASIPADAPVSTGVLIETDDGYATITRGYNDETSDELPPVEVPLFAVGIGMLVFVGLWSRESR
jgi:hypothetical protein